MLKILAGLGWGTTGMFRILSGLGRVRFRRVLDDRMLLR